MEFMKPMVLPVQIRAAERHGTVDLYIPSDERRPAIIFVHGGPLPPGMDPLPREWPLFQAYASLAADRGVVGAVVEHRLQGPDSYPAAADDVAGAVKLLRDDPRVDGERVVIWYFSGAGRLAADLLRDPPEWLRAVAMTYPMLTPFPDWPDEPRFRPAEAVASAGSLPIILTRVGQENPAIAEGVAVFVAAAEKANLQVIDVPDGGHGFDNQNDSDESRAAIVKAFDLVLSALS
ncbi:alpha/beta hydrolase [Actinoplanes sp. DH11]|uniref:alpha/beta hydrolase n=1 Tax=Actinoplanes sp. DH11 TaxID=2857011 RepID=UPI001E63E6C5|nr:dienelactone hydrolase family protein [Actinoplanes sp. DH11]